MANEFVQTMVDARVDAQSLSDFVFKPSGFKVVRRLAPTIDTLQFYIDRFDATKATTDAYVATIPNIVNDAINNTAVEGGVLADTFVTMTANGAGSVPRNLRDVNSDTTNLINFIPPSEMAAIQNRTSTYDCSAALAAAVATGKRVIIPTAGTYKFVAGYNGTTDFDVEATTTGVVFDFNDSVADYPITNGGSLTKLSNSFTAPSKMDLSVTFGSVTGLNVGDWLCFYCPTDASYSAYRANYRAGEWARISSIVGNKVVFERPFTDSLVGLQIELYKLNSVACKLRNIKLLRQNNATGIVKFSLSANASDKEVSAESATNSVIFYDRCVKPESHSATGSNAGRGTDDYFISLGNCQSARIYNADIYSRRHAVALGGGNDVCSVPVTDFKCYDSVLRADPDALVGAADMHGNVRNSSYERCTIYAGSNIGGGDNNWIIDCEIYADSSGRVGSSRELVGGAFGWIKCKLHLNGSPRVTGRGLFDIGGNSTGLNPNTVRDVSIHVEQVKIISNQGLDSGVGEMLMKARVSAYAHNLKIIINGVESLSVMPKLYSILRILNDDSSGTATEPKSNGIIIDNITSIQANDFIVAESSTSKNHADSSMPLRLMEQSGFCSGTTTLDSVESLTPYSNYKIRYPREPVLVGSTYAVGSVSPLNNIGGQGVVAIYAQVKSDSIRAKLVLPSATKFTEDTYRVFWRVGINEL